MITFDQFLQQYNNTFVKVLPNPYPPQCFDLVTKWTDNLGIPHAPGNPSPFPYSNAFQIYTQYGTFQQQYFDRIFNGPNDIPQKGDIVVWNYTYNGGAGHTAIATGVGDVYSIKCFEQNDPENWLAKRDSHVRSYSYSNILGWLRPKVQVLTDAQKISKITDLIKSNQADSDVRYQIKQILGI